jgi:hypothetical protein
MGKTMSRYSFTKPCRISVFTRAPLPKTRTFVASPVWVPSHSAGHPYRPPPSGRDARGAYPRTPYRRIMRYG